LNFDGIVADKHSIGGLPGTRATMIVVPIIASAGFTIPKTSSRAITSPAGTADVMEVLAKVNFTPDHIYKIINETSGCITWNGHLGIAPADDILIQVEKPLSFESFDKLIVSIMAKKVAVSANHLVIDMPIGPNMKIQYKSDAQKVAKKFKELGKKFGMHIIVDINEPKQPSGNGIGPYLEAIDVMKVLEQTKDRPMELEERSISLASQLLDLCYKTKNIPLSGITEAKRILTNGKALDKFREILKAQYGNPDITSTKMKMKSTPFEILSLESGKIVSVNISRINSVAKILGAPSDIYAGIYMNKRLNDNVKKNESLMSLYSSNEHKLQEAKETLNRFPIYNIS
jgi:putative thymidine phosphorylase